MSYQVCYVACNVLYIHIYSPSLPKSMVIKTQIPKAYLCRCLWAMCKFSINMLYKVFETCHIASYKSQFNERGGRTSQYKKQTSYHKYHFSSLVSVRPQVNHCVSHTDPQAEMGKGCMECGVVLHT